MASRIRDSGCDDRPTVVIPPAQVPAAERTIAILRHLAERHRPVPAASIARSLGLPRSTTYHLLGALERAGMVTAYADQRTWGLGIATFELGQAYLRQIPLERIARPVIRALADDIGETAHLAVLHGNEVLYLVKEDAATATPLVTDVGVRLPAHLTATGRAMMAAMSDTQVRALFTPRRPLVNRTGRGPRDIHALMMLLEQERATGWSTERGHVSDDIASVAVSLHTAGSRPEGVGRPGEHRSAAAEHSPNVTAGPSPVPIAAIGISVWEPRLAGSAVAEMVALLRAAAHTINSALAFNPI